MAFDWYFRRRYSFLLLAILLLLLLHPMVRVYDVARWLYDLFLTLVFLAAFLALVKRKPTRVAAVLLGVPTVIANWLGYVLPGLPSQPMAVGFHVLAAAFLGITAVAILLTIHEAQAVSADSLAGAFTGYVLAGVVFSHVYCILEAVAPGSFRVPAELAAELADPARSRSVLNYFSFITLTTVGYGDVTPATPAARDLACVEAVVGQFYIAVVMAELIGLKVSQPRGPHLPAPPG
jgi:hypothetical protein